MADQGDETAAGIAGRRQLRASRTDREQAVEALKTAFVEDRLTKDELDLRVGQALVARTCAELAAVTADIPAGPAPAPPRLPGRARKRAPVNRTTRDVTIGLAIGLPLAVALVVSGIGLLLLPVAFGFLALMASCVVIKAADTSPRKRRPRGQLPPRPGRGGQAPEARPAPGAG